MAEKCKDLSPMVSFDLIVEPSDQVKKKDVADDALSVDVRSITPTMKAIIFPKNAASAHPANHSRIVAMMFTALSEKPSGNGLPRPALSRASEPMSRWWTSSMNMSMRTMTPISTSAPSLLNK